MAEEVDRLGNEIPDGSPAVFVPWRDDLDHGNDAAEVVPDDDAIRALGVDTPRGPAHDPRDGAHRGDDTLLRSGSRLGRGPSGFDGQNVRLTRPGSLFD